jgi:hypothetical protein
MRSDAIDTTDKLSGGEAAGTGGAEGPPRWGSRARRRRLCVRLPRAADPVSKRLLVLGCQPIDVNIEAWQGT